MAQRKIWEQSASDTTVKVYYDPEYSEYVAKIYRNGKHYEPADAFDGDRESIIGTAESMLRESAKRKKNLIQPIKVQATKLMREWLPYVVHAEKDPKRNPGVFCEIARFEFSDDARLFANSYADAHGFRVEVGADRE